MKKYRYIILGVLIVGVGVWAISRSPIIHSSEVSSEAEVMPEAPKDRIVTVGIESGMTFSTVSEEAGIGGTLMYELLTAAEPVYDLASVRAGRDVVFYFEPDSDILKKVIYQIDSEEELYIEKDETAVWVAKREPINYEVKIREVGGTITSSLYESALEKDLDVRAIIELADVFQWTIDFGVGIRVGDSYQFVYEERYRDGQYVMPGTILAARFVNDGRVVEGYFYANGLDEDGETKDGYYDPDGQSLQKIFLKSPVSYKYITSGFTSGPRYVDAFKVYTSSHRAIDYAAAIGTPVRAVGNGTVIFAGWNSQGYGNFVSIRHNDTYTTNYAHLSKINVKKGQHVEQSQVIGGVGSTGFSTGPHLHYEMVKNGTKINPLTVELPSDESILDENLEKYKQDIIPWRERLEKIGL